MYFDHYTVLLMKEHQIDILRDVETDRLALLAQGAQPGILRRIIARLSRASLAAPAGNPAACCQSEVTPCPTTS